MLALPGAAWADVVQPDLAAYARARAADADGRTAAAAKGYGAALAQSPDDPVIAVRAYREALAAGDMQLALRASFVLVKARAAPADVAILLFAGAVAGGDIDTADRAADGLAKGPLGFLAPSMKAWIAQQRGTADPFTLLQDPAEANVLARRLAAENRALLMIARGDRANGLAAVRTMLTIDAEDSPIRIDAAMLLLCLGEREEARALVPDVQVVPDIDRGQRKRCAKPGAAFGTARLFTRLATELADGEAHTLTIVLARAALLMDPTDDRARLALATALSRDDATDEALATLDAISPARRDAVQAARIDILDRAGRRDQALKVARVLASGDAATSADAQRLGDLLVADGAYAEGAAAYATAIERADGDAAWLVYVQRGGALEQAGQWPEAKAMLERAVALAPDEAVALNYLGYAQVERGEDLPAARALLERAAKLRPDDPGITDSLGWAYFRSGQPAKALPLLETAARARPSSATVNDHLGDAYWALGRRYEARYAWRAAAIVADADETKRITAKLTQGPGKAQ